MTTTSRRELSGPALARAPEPHLLAALWRWADREPDRPLLAARRGSGFEDQTADTLRGVVRAVAGGLIARGVEPGDRVALLARTSVEWIHADHAILAAGAVSVPIYDTSSPSQVERILADSGAVLVLVETAEQARTVTEVASDVPVLAFEDDALGRLGAAGDEHLAVVEERVAALTGDDLAALIYSSGTTGEPKGCELTHGNLCANARQTAEQVPELFPPGARTLVFLPLAHALARIQVHTSIQEGVRTGVATGIAELPEELALFSPTFIVAVPRIFEKVYRGASLKAAAGGRQRIFDRAAAVARRWARARGGRPSPWLAVQHRLFDRLVYGRIREAFGGSLELAICGGAALDGDLARFFDGVGITVLQGYGLTEASPIVSGGPTGEVDHDTVGRLFPATTVRVADDDELLVRGPQVFAGYWHAPDATAAVREGDWLRTGDLGAFTPAGDLVITGRKKDIIVTAGGKNVAVGPLEDRVRSHPLVDQCVVIGERRPFVSALVFLDREEVERRRASGSEPADDDAIAREIGTVIADANSTVSRTEAIRSHRVIADTLSIEAGELTPTMKLRRRIVEDRFRADVDDIYG